MKKVLFIAKFCCIFGLLLSIFGCAVSPRSECEISEADAKRILGVSVLPIDKTDPLFSGTENDPNVRGCGYVSKEDKDIRVTSMVWGEVKYENSQKAQETLADYKNMPKSDYARSSSMDNISGLGDEAILSQQEEPDRKSIIIKVRKAETLMTLMVAKQSSSAIPVEEVKSLAKQIAGRTLD